MPNRERQIFSSKSGPRFLKLLHLGRTDPFSFETKFPEILAEWIAPLTSSKVKKRLVLVASQFKFNFIWN